MELREPEPPPVLAKSVMSITTDARASVLPSTSGTSEVPVPHPRVLSKVAPLSTTSVGLFWASPPLGLFVSWYLF